MKRYKNIVTLDFETYYDADYTLRKMSNTSYIRDSRFKAQLVGIKKDTWAKTRWFPHDKIKKGLAQIDWSTTGLLCHHTHFDGLILNHHYNIRPVYYLDTLSMARPLHGGAIRNDLNTLAKFYGLGNKLPDVLEHTKGVRDLPTKLMRDLGDYCCVDVELTEQLYRIMESEYPEPELDLIHHTVSLFCDPICIVNKKIAKEEHAKEVKRREKLLASVPYTATQLRSRVTFPEILREHGVEPPTKISPTTKKETYAFAKTDLDWIEMQQHPDPTVRRLCEAKALVASSIDETRALRLLEHADPALPIYLNYGKAHTFRWTGGDKMNPQNFPRESRLRNAICAPRGHRFVIIDSSQIEARVNAWLSNEEELLDGFRTGRDIYSEFAAEKIYYKPVKAVTKIERFVGKVCILGLGYQMGWKKFKHALNVGQMGPPVFLDNNEQYEQIVYAYRGKYRDIVNQWTTMDNFLYTMRTCRADEYEEYGPIEFERGRVLLPNGMKLLYPGLKVVRSEKNPDWTETVYNGSTKVYGGLLTENIIQALARIVVAEQIAQVAWDYKVVLMVHDEVILCVPTREAKKAYNRTLDAFHTPPTWAPDLPVAGEGGITTYYKKL